MKYKSAVFAVKTDGNKPLIPDEIKSLCYAAFFAYDIDNMASVCFVILPDEFDTDAARAAVPFYEGYEIDMEKHKENIELLNNEIDYLNGVKARPKTIDGGIFKWQIYP